SGKEKMSLSYRRRAWLIGSVSRAQAQGMLLIDWLTRESLLPQEHLERTSLDYRHTRNTCSERFSTMAYSPALIRMLTEKPISLATARSRIRSRLKSTIATDMGTALTR